MDRFTSIIRWEGLGSSMAEWSLLKILLTVVGAVVFSLLAVGLYLALKLWPMGGDVPQQKTPAWWLKDLNQYEYKLLLRRETEAGGALLVKRTDLETIYRYDPQTRLIGPVTDSQWQNSAGPITNCFDYSTRNRDPDGPSITINEPEHKLLIGKRGAWRELRTAGGYPLADRESPSGRWVAVLSGTGPAIPPILPFLGGDWILGQRYHEIMSIADAAPVGKAIKFPA
jgi:hypothetical protein